MYPGATHTRTQHSLGTYGNACRIVYALWNDPINPIFRQIIDERDLRGCLLAALLHDLGQHPLAHDLEEADGKFFDHDEIGYRFVDERIENQASLNSLIDALWRVGLGRPTLSQRVADILHADVEDITQPIRDRILHSVIDGPIDADKLDYLGRDSKKLNVPYGLAIDFERLSKVLTVIHEKKDDYMWAAMGVHEKGKVSAESVAFVRYALFGAVYWHRTSRSVKAMLHHATWEMLATLSNSRRDSLREEFIELILANKLPALQQDLFAQATSHRMKQALWPGISPSDLQVLAWLWEQCGEKGKRIIEGLAVRNLYKRVLVVSKEKRGDIWSKAHKFASTALPAARIGLDSHVEEKLVRYLRDLSTEERGITNAFSDDALSTRTRGCCPPTHILF